MTWRLRFLILLARCLRYRVTVTGLGIQVTRAMTTADLERALRSLPLRRPGDSSWSRYRPPTKHTKE